MSIVHSKKFNQQIKSIKIQLAGKPHKNSHPQTFLTQETALKMDQQVFSL